MSIQALRLATPVAGFNELELELTVYQGVAVTVEIWTGMQTESEDGWVQLGSFTATTAASSTTATFSNPLAFIRWKCTFGSTCTFMITGVGRRT